MIIFITEAQRSKATKAFRKAVGNDVIVKLIKEAGDMLFYLVPAEYHLQFTEARDGK